jgi:hypothetical protein
MDKRLTRGGEESAESAGIALPSSNKLELEVGQLRQLCQLKDEDFQKCWDSITSLADVNARQFANLEQENHLIECEDDELKRCYLRVMSATERVLLQFTNLKRLPSLTTEELIVQSDAGQCDRRDNGVRSRSSGKQNVSNTRRWRCCSNSTEHTSIVRAGRSWA